MKPVEEIAQWIADRKCRGLNDPDTEGCPAQPDQCECEMLDAIAAALRAERERAERAEAERDEARKLYEAADKQLGLHLNGTVHETLQDLVREADARAATARNRALEEGYLAGFLVSGEGWNGEYPGDAHEQPYWTKRRDEELAALRTKEGE